MTSINISDVQMQAIIAKSIMDNITPENRDEIMRSALAEIMTPQKDPYNRSKNSPLQQAFVNAAENVANKIAREKLEEDEAFKKEIENLFNEVSKRLFADEVREVLIDKICSAVKDGLSERYR